ncbi:hypothetical protein UCDDS831_g07542 [Diplodia seriata]|uniref:Uncharacterized protein n=1 Tax=Diplodia seriata TaxID=420778 RepID=A0A0G2DXF1_9PEZI|nr:hypothetical protein UCDDS831_g07542 [Diplodia seriata]
MDAIRLQFPHAAVEPTTADRFQELRDNNDVRCPVCFRDIDFAELGHQEASSSPQHQEASSPPPQHRRRNNTSTAEESYKDSAATVASPPPQRRRPTNINTPENSSGNAAATVLASLASTAGTPETATNTHAVIDFSSPTSATTIPLPASTGTPELTTHTTEEPSSSRIAAAVDEADTDTDTSLSRTDLVTMTVCNHVICASCQLTWLQAEAGGRPFFYSSSCALCRHSTLTPEHLQQQQQRASAATSAEATATFRADLLLTPAPAAPTPIDQAAASPSDQLAFYASSFDHAVRSLTPIRATTDHLIRAGAAITTLLASRPAADAADAVDPVLANANGADDDVHGFARPALTAPHFLGAAAALPDFAEGVVRALDGDRDTGVGSAGSVWRALVSMLLGR